MSGTNALGGIVTAQTVTVACTVAQVEAVDTVLATLNVPNQATILDVILTVTDMDTSTGLLLDVGDASGPETPDDDRFIAAFTGQAAGSIRASDSAGLLEGVYKYRGLAGTDTAQSEQAIQATVNTAATTGAAGTLTLTVVYYA